MNLLLCAISLSSVALAMKITLDKSYRPNRPFWLNESFVLYISAPMISGLLAIGIIFAMKTIANFPPSLAEFRYTLLVAGVTFLLLRSITKSRSSNVKGETKVTGQLINVEFGSPDCLSRQEDGHNKNPDLKKAA